MTRDQIDELMRENGIVVVGEAVYSLVQLVIKHEREACAKVCEETTAAWTQHLYNSGCVDCAAAIRARRQQCG